MDMNPSEINELETVFKQIDKDKDNHIDNKELLNAFHCLGYREMTEKDTLAIMKEVDLNHNNTIEYSEFVLMMKKFKKLGLNSDHFKKILNKTGDTTYRIEGTGSYSTFSEEEKKLIQKS
jgi:Ca2+-binding EF-hand superfamily protein